MQAEMEAELEKLSTQILQILSQQEEQKKHWFRWGVGAGFIGVVLSIVSLIIAVITAAGPTPPVAYILGLAVPQLLVLAGAFNFCRNIARRDDRVAVEMGMVPKLKLRAVHSPRSLPGPSIFR